jgi:hypothetical protein
MVHLCLAPNAERDAYGPVDVSTGVMSLLHEVVGSTLEPAPGENEMNLLEVRITAEAQFFGSCKPA